MKMTTIFGFASAAAWTTASGASNGRTSAATKLRFMVSLTPVLSWVAFTRRVRTLPAPGPQRKRGTPVREPELVHRRRARPVPAATFRGHRGPAGLQQKRQHLVGSDEKPLLETDCHAHPCPLPRDAPCPCAPRSGAESPPRPGLRRAKERAPDPRRLRPQRGEEPARGCVDSWRRLAGRGQG